MIFCFAIFGMTTVLKKDDLRFAILYGILRSGFWFFTNCVFFVLPRASGEILKKMNGGSGPVRSDFFLSEKRINWF